MTSGTKQQPLKPRPRCAEGVCLGAQPDPVDAPPSVRPGETVAMWCLFLVGVFLGWACSSIFMPMLRDILRMWLGCR